MKLYINSRDELHIIELADVEYLKASGNYTDFHYVDGHTRSELSCLSAFEQAIGNLYTASPFFRMGRSHLVNTDQLQAIHLQRQTLRFMSGTELSLPKEHLRRLREHILSLRGIKQPKPGIQTLTTNTSDNMP